MFAWNITEIDTYYTYIGTVAIRNFSLYRRDFTAYGLFHILGRGITPWAPCMK